MVEAFTLGDKEEIAPLLASRQRPPDHDLGPSRKLHQLDGRDPQAMRWHQRSVAQEVVTGERTMTKLATACGAHLTIIHLWKSVLLNGAGDTLGRDPAG